MNFDFDAEPERPPEVQEFLDRMRAEKEEREKAEKIAAAQREQDARQAAARATLRQLKELDPKVTIIIGRSKGVWTIDCGRCDFVFERTKIDIARTWADEHNDTVHEGTLTVVDRTR